MFLPRFADCAGSVSSKQCELTQARNAPVSSRKPRSGYPGSISHSL